MTAAPGPAAPTAVRASPPRRLPWPRRVLRGVLGVAAALWILLEEWIWKRATAAMRWLGRLPFVRAMETRIARLGPWPAMALFVVPWLLLLPVKVLGVWLIASGRTRLGVLVFVLAKVLGTAVLARLFALTRPALLTVGWFRRLHDWFLVWKGRLFAYVRSLGAVRWAKAFARAVRVGLRARLRRWRRWWRAVRA